MKSSVSRGQDWLLIIATFLLGVFGLLMVFSSSYIYALYKNGNYAFFFQRQLMWFTLATFAFIFFLFVPYQKYRKITVYLYFLAVALLVLVPLVGVEINNAKRWLSFGPFTVQPTEFVKLAMIIYLAHVYSNKNSYIDNFVRGVMPPLIAVAVILGLIMLQPDLGSATAILAVTCCIVFFSGAKMRHLLGLGLVVASLFVAFAISEEYRLERLTSFVNPFQYADDSGYQVIQAYIGIAHGGLTGTGIGNSVIKHMFLPEPHTDFILAVILEELGIFGAIFIFACYSIILIRGVYIGIRCKNLFGSLLAFGIVFQIMIQVVFNVGAVIGLLPITGIPLPLISNGGSSLLVTMVSLAILANISKYNMREKEKHSKIEGGNNGRAEVTYTAN